MTGASPFTSETYPPLSVTPAARADAVATEMDLGREAATRASKALVPIPFLARWRRARGRSLVQRLRYHVPEPHSVQRRNCRIDRVPTRRNGYTGHARPCPFGRPRTYRPAPLGDREVVALAWNFSRSRTARRTPIPRQFVHTVWSESCDSERQHISVITCPLAANVADVDAESVIVSPWPPRDDFKTITLPQVHRLVVDEKAICDVPFA